MEKLLIRRFFKHAKIPKEKKNLNRFTVVSFILLYFTVLGITIILKFIKYLNELQGPHISRMKTVRIPKIK